jgi:hypothetical protein
MTTATDAMRDRVAALVTELDGIRCLDRPGAARLEGA